MTETGAKLSKTFHGTHFIEAIEDWNATVANQLTEETIFRDLANSRIDEAFPDEPDYEESRDVVASALDGATSAEAYRRSYGGWAEVGLDDEIDERGARLELFSTSEARLLADLGRGLSDAFELYALKRHLPRQKPTPVSELLARIAATKLDLINFDNFTHDNAGQVFRRVGVLAFHTGKFSDKGIALANNRVVVPTVSGSTRFARYDRRGGMQIMPDPNYSVEPKELDGGIKVQDPSELIRLSGFWKIFLDRRTVWSVGEMPEGPLVYDDDPAGEYYQENAAHFEAHVVALRKMSKIALRA